MNQSISNKWVLFAKRPTNLLQRQLRNRGVLFLKTISILDLSEILIISRSGVCEIYVDRKEHSQNYHLIEKIFRTGKTNDYFKKFDKIIKNYQSTQTNNPLQKAIESHERLFPILVFSHYIEDILTPAKQQHSSRGSYDLDRLIYKNSKFRDRVININDNFYDRAYQYLKRKYQTNKVNYYLLKELITSKEVSNQDLQSRQKLYVLRDKQKVSRVYTGKKAQMMIKKFGLEEPSISKEVSREISGVVVCFGQVSGQVVIINKESDFKKDYKNKIIISPMTIPQFTPYLKKVKAIITDEGGLNCHAAITAREFKIPCIVGTKIATQVFKDGDRVEVDANKGVVRKINK